MRPYIVPTKIHANLDRQEHRDPRTSRIIAASIEVHRQLGPGLPESVYQECLSREFSLRGIHFVRELELPVTYKGLKLDCGYRVDFVIEDEVIVELKSVEHLLPVHEAQLITYLRLTGKHIGLLINFNVPLLTEGIIRRVL